MSYAGIAYALRHPGGRRHPDQRRFLSLLQGHCARGHNRECASPGPVAAGWEVSFRVAEACFRALAQAVPDRVVAGTKGCICNVAFGGIGSNGKYYAYYETLAGGGGAPPDQGRMDAIQTHIHNTENAPVEEIELEYPVRIPRVALIPDSEGAGKFRGGLGVRRDYWFPDASPKFSILSDRAKFAPVGTAWRPRWPPRALHSRPGWGAARAQFPRSRLALVGARR